MGNPQDGVVVIHDHATPNGQMQRQRIEELIDWGRERNYPSRVIASAILVDLLNRD